jgi:FkbM family methyltransferase
MFYGQHKEDEFISKLFPDGFKGGCIEIGAACGYGSNTRYFEDNGWYSMCIEPNPRHLELLKKERRKSVILNYAISDYNEQYGTFNVVNLDGYNEEAGSGLVLDDRIIKDHIEMFPNLEIKQIPCEIRTLDYCISYHYKYKTIDFVSIDTEGTELDVLKGFDINKWKPKVFIIENNYEDKTIENYLKEFNYQKIKRIQVNDIYIRKGIRDNYYAEYGTDKYIRETHFPYLDNGIMVEVGAGPPTFYSMSKHFREDHWRCICVEPNPKFVEMHKQEENEVYQLACSFEEKKNIDFQVVYTNMWGKDIDGVSLSSLVIKDNYLKMKEMYPKMVIENIKVDVKRLDTLLEELNINHIDFLSVDTEGWELEVMRGFNIQKYNPKVVVLENIEHLDEYNDYMKTFEYYLDNVIEYNYIYIKK